MRTSLPILLALACVASRAHASPDDAVRAPSAPAPTTASSDDGYCDFVKNVATATNAVLYAPEAFVTFGYIEVPPTAIQPTVGNTGLRLLAGFKYKLSGIYEGLAHRDHARADCRRHRALDTVQNVTLARALDARGKVLDDALAKTDAILAHDKAEAEAHRLTAQEATATQLRVDELRQLAALVHHQRAALPPSNIELGGALVEFQRADDDVENAEGRLRKAQAFDISVRVGIDEFFNQTNANPYFAVLNVGVNLGVLWQGSANDRAAAARRKLTREGHERLTFDASAQNLKMTLDQERARVEQATALVVDLQRQLDQLDKLQSEESKRFRQTVWFDWVKASAERAYLEAHVEAIQQVLGGATP